MYLKKIEMQGFKSFADKTKIEFEDNITAIVGPNGSGKSNVSDAIRWVLGEQSAKSLRGGKMEDIIFSGTDKRRALGFAEVTLYFENSSRAIPIDYNEVAITRRIFRSGDSEFYINKNSCRLKDIRELFMDTGIGRDGYSIIGQGRIEGILSERPEERRAIFEEAAGIIKYKNKKEQTEKKLEKTEENLIRINDLFNEVSKQYNSLEKESTKALEYKKLHEKVKKVEVNILTKNIKENKEKILDLDDQIGVISKNIEESEIKRNKIEDSFKKIKEEIKNKDNLIENIREKNNEYNKLINEKRNKSEILSQRNIYQEREKKRLLNEIKSLKDSNQKLLNKININKISLEDCKKNLSKLEIDYEEKSQSLSKFNKNIYEQELEIEREKYLLLKKSNEISDIMNKLDTIKSFNANIDDRIKKIDKMKMLNKDKLTSIEEELDIKKKNKIKVKKDMESIKNEINDLEEKRNKNNKKDIKMNKTINNLRIDLQSSISRHNLFKNMEEDYEGYYRSVKNLLNSIDNEVLQVDGFIGIVADLITVDKAYTKAIETTLGSNMQNIVTKTDKDAKKMIRFLRKNNMGRATFLPITSVKGRTLDLNWAKYKDYGVLGLAKNLVEYDREYDGIFNYLLGRTIIIDTLDNATKLAKKFNHRYRMVTLKGDIINPGGSLSGGSYSNNNLSLISRKSKILELEKYILEERKKLRILEEEQFESRNKFNDNQEELESKLNEEKKIEINMLNLDNTIDSLMKEIKRLEEEYQNFVEEKKILNKQILDYNKNKKEYKTQIKISNQNLKEIELKIEKLNFTLEKNKSEQEKISDNVTDFKIKINKTKNNIENLSEKIYMNSNSINLNKDLIKEKEETIQSINNDKKKILKEKEVLLKKIELKEELISSERKKLDSKIYEKDKLMENFYNIQEKLRNINDNRNLQERKLNSLELKKSKIKIKIENDLYKLESDYNTKYTTGLKNFNPNIDIDKIQPKVDQLHGKIKKLGNINLGSIEEFKKVSERFEFLSNQKKDLTSSKDDLEKVIEDIEEEMTIKFIESFEIINSNFTKIFKVLFNGGEASLNIEDKDNILESGIEINAQPPGKRLQNISLLSGGEKSLTAVALLFAILEMKPSPFCILDEIDAALDDANIGRYTDYLKSLNDTTQFILITHRKSTMEISNVLYGVTMEEDGVSKLYSVKMKDYVE